MEEQEQLELEGLDIPEPDYEPAKEVANDEGGCEGGACKI